MRGHLLPLGAWLLVLTAVPATQASSRAPAKAKMEPSAVKQINAMVAAIDKKLKQGQHPSLNIHEDPAVPTEGAPPQLKLYYEPEPQRLVAAVIAVGHETWSTEFRYYFYPNGKLMKYSKTIDGRDDHPPKEAMIYDKNGKLLWKNTDEQHVAAAELLRLFDKLQEIQLRFAAY